MSSLFAPKDLKCGFIVLCTENNPDLLRYTFRSIQCRYGTPPIIAVADDSAKDQEITEMKTICPTYKGQKTFTSLINLGFDKAETDWNFVLIAGTTMRGSLDLKMSCFVNTEKDILFPISEGKTNFIEATLNGLLINKKTFKAIGDMPEEESLEMSKAEWAMKAIDYGCKFKAIIGAKLC